MIVSQQQELVQQLFDRAEGGLISGETLVGVLVGHHWWKTDSVDMAAGRAEDDIRQMISDGVLSVDGDNYRLGAGLSRLRGLASAWRRRR